ncbi:TadE/TadG family type IV pilus assembly protein [Streptomyces dubilierae]|uniref:TadE/TadG family type IV pilus assembly protein n=1 Tax=Streptomyces dubilierae TaxID=3075533 RepID=A0ABU2P4T7_9ACTN|nr:TadE/TadG family type IV pilus assembly protein [Streptomyces sp. DSM 41921]MDT0387161.1 TadE/TadG family type IV pilus assembly protein [Streptomyces sp. DSM 41921]
MARTGVSWTGTARTGPAGSGPAGIGKGRDRGQVAIEYIGFLPILLLVALAAVQLGLIAYTAQQAGTAARAGARSASLAGPHEADCRAAVSSWLADGTSCPASIGGDEVTVTATVQIPSVVPGWDFGPAVKTATMPRDH